MFDYFKKRLQIPETKEILFLYYFLQYMLM